MRIWKFAKAIALAGAIVAGSTHAAAQTSTDETAKPYDTVSSTGVSYGSGSFTYNPSIVAAGDGDAARALSYGLRYDSSGQSTAFAWVDSLFMGTSQTLVDAAIDDFGKPHPPSQTWSTQIIGGQRADKFERFGSMVQNTYTPVFDTGSTLEFIGTNASGHYKYIGSAGEILELAWTDSTKTKLTNPDGSTITQGCPTGVRCWYTNLGMAIVVQTVSSTVYKVCAVNLTQYDLATLSTCPSGVPTATVSGAATNTRGFGNITSLTFPDGGVETYSYNSNGLLTCIKNSGVSNCRTSNTYDTCAANQPGGSLPPGRNRVTAQSLTTGETKTYVYSSPSLCGYTSVTENQTNGTLGTASTVVTISIDGQVTSAVNPIGKQYQQTWKGNNSATLDYGTPLLDTLTRPELDKVVFTYDARGNLLETRRKAKTAGPADIVTSASFPSTCSNRVTCNKPISTTDARGKVTDYTYDATHGGVLTVTGPADAGGVRPQTRYAYTQRYAWVKSGSGYAHAASPVWLLASEEFCKTTAASGSSCAGGASDEVVTTYDYGPDSGPNNLWLRGKVVTADGVSLRTCYQRDSYGRVIAETSPNANLSNCS